MIGQRLKDAIENSLRDTLSNQCSLKGTTPISGGSINQTYRLDTSQGRFFLKINNKQRFPSMFELEARGLQLLNDTDAIHIPEVICLYETSDEQFLILEYIETSNPIPQFWELFGISMATLHKSKKPHFGLDHDNYIGSLHQKNKIEYSWIDFFIDSRIEPQIRLARDKGHINTQLTNNFNSLYNELPNIFPPTHPSLIHGDLWSGNFMPDSYGRPCVFDPAVYYGHREVDIAMTKLFGGFTDKFYDGYNEEYPLLEGWEGRLDYYNLYPLLVHVNLFGASYLSQIKEIIKRF